MTPDRNELIRLREEQKMTRPQIADHYGVSIATVRRWIKDLDIPRPPRRSPMRNRRKARKEQLEGFTALEQARHILGVRVIEKKNFGYYLDGSPASAEKIIAAAGLESKPVR